MPTIKYFLIITTALLGACGNLADDLKPSGEDLRSTITANSTGALPSQKAADFSAPQTTGGQFVLSDYLAGGASAADAVVLYFSMWCPICLAHTDHMLYTIMPQFQQRGNVRFVLVDYVSGSIQATTNSEAVNGYQGSAFTVIADESGSLMKQFNGAMGKTIVIDSSGSIQMNEDFRSGDHLISILNTLLP